MISVAVTPRMDQQQYYKQSICFSVQSEKGVESGWFQLTGCCIIQVRIGYVQSEVVIKENKNKERLGRKTHKDMITVKLWLVTWAG